MRFAEVLVGNLDGDWNRFMEEHGWRSGHPSAIIIILVCQVPDGIAVSRCPCFWRGKQQQVGIRFVEQGCRGETLIAPALIRRVPYQQGAATGRGWRRRSMFEHNRVDGL